MKVCGFTIVRNAIKYDYPIIESITSILEICDKFIVAVGKSEDNTLDLIKSIDSPKIEIVETLWDENLKKGGNILAVETNKAFDKISNDYDWCFYLQGDEVVHEKYLDTIKQEMQNNLKNEKVEGLLFKYLHFYGSYNFIGDSRTWYRSEVRIIRNNKKIRSFRDAQGFKSDGKLIRVKKIDAYIYHYGWVKPPDKQQEKQKNFKQYWNDISWFNSNNAKKSNYDYSDYDSLKVFEQTHPKVMQGRIKNQNWKFEADIKKKNFKNIIHKFLYVVEKTTNYRVGEYKNYKEV